YHEALNNPSPRQPAWQHRRRYQMAHDPHATALIKGIKATRKRFQDSHQTFYVRFITQKRIPTEDDVEALTKLVVEMEQVSKVVQEDLHEMQQAASGFGGSADTEIRSAHNLLDTVKKKAQL